MRLRKFEENNYRQVRAAISMHKQKQNEVKPIPHHTFLLHVCYFFRESFFIYGNYVIFIYVTDELVRITQLLRYFEHESRRPSEVEQ